jgi:hypothetical protein
MHAFGVYTKKGKTFIWRVHKKKNKYAHTKKRKEKMHAFGVYTPNACIFSFLLTCTHTHKNENMCLACTQRKGKHVFGVYTVVGMHAFGVYTKKGENIRLACTHENRTNMRTHKRKEKSMRLACTHTNSCIFSFLLACTQWWECMCLACTQKKGETFVWRVHTKKVENMCLVCTQKRKEKNNNKQIDVYIQKKTQTKQTNKQTKIRKKSKT